MTTLDRETLNDACHQGQKAHGEAHGWDDMRGIFDAGLQAVARRVLEEAAKVLEEMAAAVDAEAESVFKGHGAYQYQHLLDHANSIRAAADRLRREMT